MNFWIAFFILVYLVGVQSVIVAGFNKALAEKREGRKIGLYNVGMVFLAALLWPAFLVWLTLDSFLEGFFDAYSGGKK